MVAAARRDILPEEWFAQPAWLGRAYDVLAPYLGDMLSYDGRSEGLD